MPSVRASALFLIATAARLLAQNCLPLPATFSDSVFNDADWTLTAFPLGPGGSASAGQLFTDGNPTPSRFIAITINDGGTITNNATVLTFSAKRGAVWNPATMGAIVSIDYCEDAKAIASGSLQATSVAVRQNGRVYIGVPGSLFTPNQPSPAWTRISRLRFRQSDFGGITGTLNPLYMGNPDFSASGAPIEFGFYRGNSGFPGYTTRAAIDNWAVTVNTSEPRVLSFTAIAGGEPPDPQFIDIGATPPATVRLTPLPAVPWLVLSQSTGATPLRVRVGINQAGLAPGNYSTTLSADVPGSGTSLYDVTLRVIDALPQIAVTPGFVDLTTRGTADAAAFVQNVGGGGPQPFSVAVTSNSPWLSASAAAARTVSGGAAVTISASAASLAAGSYSGNVRVTSGATNRDIGVALFVPSDRPVLELSQRGLRFDTQEGVATQETQVVQARYSGPGSPALNVNVRSAEDWLAFAAEPGRVTFSIKPNGLRAGSYYALVTVSSQGVDAPPQNITAIYNVTAAAPLPAITPTGLLFVAVEGGAAPPAQNINVVSNTTAPRRFVLETSVSTPQNWLRVPNPSGSAGSGVPVRLPVSVDPSGLTAGIYRGELTTFYPADGITRTGDVVLVVLPAGARPNTKATERAVTGCTPAALAVLQTGTAGGFSTPAGWPVPLAFRVLDNCSEPVTNARVVVSFSNGDPPLSVPLVDAAMGIYAATWVAGRSGAVTATSRAVAPNLGSASATLGGTVTPSSIPSIAANGTLHNLNPRIGAALAPATVATVFGSSLATAADSPASVPLPTEFKGTSIIVGGREAPLYFVSSGQVNAQIPAELAPGSRYQVVAMVNGAITVPEAVALTGVAPGIASLPGGRIIAQHNDFSLVDDANPATPGEFIVMYLAGLGATSPAVNSGDPAPTAEPLARVMVMPVVLVNGEAAEVAFAGLTPGGVGLYQINFKVPEKAQNPAPVIVRQGSAESNAVTLPIRP